MLQVRYIGLTGYNLDTLVRLVKLLPPNTVDTVLSYCRQEVNLACNHTANLLATV